MKPLTMSTTIQFVFTCSFSVPRFLRAITTLILKKITLSFLLFHTLPPSNSEDRFSSDWSKIEAMSSANSSWLSNITFCSRSLIFTLLTASLNASLSVVQANEYWKNMETSRSLRSVCAKKTYSYCLPSWHSPCFVLIKKKTSCSCQIDSTLNNELFWLSNFGQNTEKV